MSTKQPVIGITERGDAGLDFSWEKEYERYGCDGVILITKHLSQQFIEKAKGYNSIVHATITGYGGTGIEPNVPSYLESAEQFLILKEEIGRERVVLRIDPIIPTEEGIRAAKKVFALLPGNRTRISFLDNYPHVRQRFRTAGLKPLQYPFHAPLITRQHIAGLFPGAEICGELGMPCKGCVSETDLQVLGIEPVSTSAGRQRPECKCLAVKRELLAHRGQCASGCLYCYWK